MKIELEIHEDYLKALNELLLKVNKKYGNDMNVGHLVSCIVRNHVLEDLKEINHQNCKNYLKQNFNDAF